MTGITLALLLASPVQSALRRVKPGADLRNLIENSKSGDTLLLEAGEYESPGYLNAIQFDPQKPVVVKAEESRRAKLTSGSSVHFHGCRGIVLQGLEITGLSGNAGLVQVSAGSDHIWLKDCHVHTAPLDADCLKANQAKNFFVEDCWFHDPGKRENGDGAQETLDYLDIGGGTIVRCLFTGGTSRQYINAKGGSRDILIDGNVLVGHDGSSGDAALILGGWSTRSFINGDFEGVNITARNNIIIGSKTGAIQVNNMDGAYIHNNLIYECEGFGEYRGLIYIAPGNGVGMNKGSRNVTVANNIFYNDSVPMPPELATLVGELSGFKSSHNLYFNGGRGIPKGGAFDPNAEDGAVFKDPLIEFSKGATYTEWVAALRPKKFGPWTDAGTALIDRLPTGLGPDILGNARPTSPDMGPFEWGVTAILRSLPSLSGTTQVWIRPVDVLGRARRQVSGSAYILEPWDYRDSE